MNSINITDLKTVRLSQDGRAVVILDQTRLPGSEVYVSLSSAEEIWEAIYKLKVRGGAGYRDSCRLWYLCLQPADYGRYLRYFLP